jgi:hypothetical protein
VGGGAARGARAVLSVTNTRRHNCAANRHIGPFDVPGLTRRSKHDGGVSMHLRLGFLALLALGLPGCVTASNTLPMEKVASFRVAAVNVGFAPGARIAWDGPAHAAAGSAAASSQAAAKPADTPEGQAAIRNALGGKTKAAMERHLALALKGTTPVRVDVTLNEVNIASPLQRIVIGGAHSMKGDVTLVDARTGAVIITYPAQTATTAAGQGIGGVLLDQALLGEPIDRVVDNFASQYAYWLVPTNRRPGGV